MKEFYTRLPERYAEANLETSKFADEIRPAAEWLQSWESQKSNLLVLGPVGVGKTYLVNAFLNWQFLKNGLKPNEDGSRIFWSSKILYATLKGIIDDIRAAWNGGDSRNSPHSYKNVRLLIIDEIGVNYGTESERIELFDVFNYRWEHLLPTVVLTNLTRDELEYMLGMRITDRLFDGATVVEVKGNSRRGGVK